MVNFKLQILLFILSVLGLVFLVNMIRKYTLELRYSLLWLLLSGVAITLSIFPIILYKVAELLGTEKPVNALFLIAIAGAFALIFSLTLVISRMSHKIKEMSQEIGLLKNEIERKNFEQKKDGVI